MRRSIKIYICGYLNRIQSSCRLEIKTHLPQRGPMGVSIELVCGSVDPVGRA
jgi:hypothetical protein